MSKKRIIIKKFKSFFEVFVIKPWRPLIRKIYDYDNQQNQIDTLYYLLNQYFNISDFPKATGVLRKVQLTDTELLRLVHSVCEKYSLKYWMDAGTLLGSVRHKGFIPWDDDVDIIMPRADYEKAFELLKIELEKYGIGISKSKGRIAISIWNAGANLDIFPMDNVSKEIDVHSVDFFKNIEKYRSLYLKKYQKANSDELISLKNKLVGPYSDSPDYWYPNPETGYFKRVHTNSSIFPLKKYIFEDYEFWVPNNFDEYLKLEYKNYMDFPTSGILHHKGTGDGIYTNSIRKNFDIDGFLEKLKEINIT